MADAASVATEAPLTVHRSSSTTSNGSNSRHDNVPAAWPAGASSTRGEPQPQPPQQQPPQQQSPTEHDDTTDDDDDDTDWKASQAYARSLIFMLRRWHLAFVLLMTEVLAIGECVKQQQSCTAHGNSLTHHIAPRCYSQLSV